MFRITHAFYRCHRVSVQKGNPASSTGLNAIATADRLGRGIAIQAWVQCTGIATNALRTPAASTARPVITPKLLMSCALVSTPS